MLRRARENRIVAVKDGLHIDVRTGYDVVGVISHPLPKGPLGLRLAGNHLAFDSDFRICRDWKTGIRTLDDLHRLSPDSAREIILRDPLRKRTGRQHVEERVLAANHHHLRALPPLEVCVAVDSSVLPLSDLAADRSLIVYLAAIGSQIVPVRVRILRDY